MSEHAQEERQEAEAFCCGSFKPGESAHIDPTYLGLTILANQVETVGKRIVGALYALTGIIGLIGGMIAGALSK